MYKTFFCNCGHFFDAWVRKDHAVVCPRCNAVRHPRDYRMMDIRPGAMLSAARTQTLVAQSLSARARLASGHKALAIVAGRPPGRGLELAGALRAAGLKLA